MLLEASERAATWPQTDEKDTRPKCVRKFIGALHHNSIIFVYFLVKGVKVWVESIKPLKAFLRDTHTLYIRCWGGSVEVHEFKQKSCLQ